ncbi:MAG: inverse autotransporter beta domain-containing protein [Proteobacteria bacterium]|nr:inverse autotransporter beta domain-containing protein [Pseudomonadota bacterium]
MRTAARIRSATLMAMALGYAIGCPTASAESGPPSGDADSATTLLLGIEVVAESEDLWVLLRTDRPATLSESFEVSDPPRLTLQLLEAKTAFPGARFRIDSHLVDEVVVIRHDQGLRVVLLSGAGQEVFEGRQVSPRHDGVAIALGARARAGLEPEYEPNLAATDVTIAPPPAAPPLFPTAEEPTETAEAPEPPPRQGPLPVVDPPTSTVVDDHAPWGAVLVLDGRSGSEQLRGQAQVMAPLWQDNRRMLFVDLRGQATNKSSTEFNLGLAYRHWLRQGAIVGGYAFADRLHSSARHTYYQGVAGLELLTLDWDVRANGYWPESTTNEDTLGQTSSGPPTSQVVVQGNSILVETTSNMVSTRRERALRGFDFEIGWRAGFLDLPGIDDETRVYAAGFHFNAPGFEDVTGGRARFETRLFELPWFGDGARFTLVGEYQWDEPRGSQLSGGARLRIPLWGWRGGSGTPAAPRARASGLARRMLDPIVRDVDVVTGDRDGLEGTPPLQEAALDPGSGQRIEDLYLFAQAGASGTGSLTDPADVAAALAAATPQQIVVAQGDAGVFVVGTTINLPSGRTLIGGSSTSLMVTTASGRTASFTIPGSRPTFQGGALNPTFTLNSGSRLAGIDTTAGAATGVITLAQNATGVLIEDVSMTTGPGIGIATNSFGTETLTLRNVTVNFAGAGTFGVFVGLSDSVTIADSLFDVTAAGVLMQDTTTLQLDRTTINTAGFGVQSLGGTITVGGANNTLGAGVTPCNAVAIITGSIDFGGAGACP